MCLRRDKPPKILRMSLGDSRDLAQTSSTARRMRETSAYARCDSGRVRRFDRPVAVSRLRDRGSVVTEMRRDDLGSRSQINGCSSRAAAAAPIAPRSRCAEHCAGDRPGRPAVDGLWCRSVTTLCRMRRKHAPLPRRSAQGDPPTSCVPWRNAAGW